MCEPHRQFFCQNFTPLHPPTGLASAADPPALEVPVPPFSAQNACRRASGILPQLRPRPGAVLVPISGPTWGPSWLLLASFSGPRHGPVCNSASKTRLEPFGAGFGLSVGSRNAHSVWEGCTIPAFPALRIGARLGSVPGSILDPSWGPSRGQNRSRKGFRNDL